jgi:DTW domain-containing protein YfiP
MDDVCPKCEKLAKLCICEAIEPVDNRIFVLILRHPQEQDRKLGTAKIATLQLKNSALKTGLSWANLSKASGIPGLRPEKMGRPVSRHRENLRAPAARAADGILNRKGGVAEDQSVLDDLVGIILLDGTWQQAKALWWRNAWMLKCRRLVLQPPNVSLYGSLRKEPRKESVSTIEAAAHTLAALENDDSLVEKILPPFKLLLKKARA